MTGHPYTYKLTIEVPDAPMVLIDPIADDILRSLGMQTTTTLTRSFSGIVTVPDGVTSEQVRQYVVNEAAREHLGKTVTITHWELTR